MGLVSLIDRVTLLVLCEVTQSDIALDSGHCSCNSILYYYMRQSQLNIVQVIAEVDAKTPTCDEDESEDNSDESEDESDDDSESMKATMYD